MNLKPDLTAILVRRARVRTSPAAMAHPPGGEMMRARARQGKLVEELMGIKSRRSAAAR